MNNKNNNDNKNNNTFADVSHINNVNNNFMNHDMVINNNDKNEEDEKNQHHGNINDTNANIQQKDEKNIPDFYTIDEETIFLNQLKCRNKFQKNIMKKLRQDGKMKYDFNIVCKNNKTEECIELSDQISKTDIET
ncbi:hypothetical protein [Plasmodium yoelii yoelii]|nr:hypothetical protein [Plasmodium yoelii yoelii]